MIFFFKMGPTQINYCELFYLLLFSEFILRMKEIGSRFIDINFVLRLIRRDAHAWSQTYMHWTTSDIFSKRKVRMMKYARDEF